MPPDWIVVVLSVGLNSRTQHLAGIEPNQLEWKEVVEDSFFSAEGWLRLGRDRRPTNNMRRGVWVITNHNGRLTGITGLSIDRRRRESK